MLVFLHSFVAETAFVQNGKKWYLKKQTNKRLTNRPFFFFFFKFFFLIVCYSKQTYSFFQA